MWIPLGIATVLTLLRTPEPARGHQDADFHDEATTESLMGVDAATLAGKLDLPAPTRIGTLDYDDCTWREAYREIFKIRSMWFGVVGITMSSGAARRALASGACPTSRRSTTSAPARRAAT